MIMLASAKVGKFVTLIMIMIMTAVGGMAARHFWPQWAEENGFEEDNPSEEAVERFFEENTGIDIDLTPYSTETDNE